MGVKYPGGGTPVPLSLKSCGIYFLILLEDVIQVVVASSASATSQLDFVAGSALATSQLDLVASSASATSQLDLGACSVSATPQSDFVASFAAAPSQLDSVASPYLATSQLDSMANPALATPLDSGLSFKATSEIEIRPFRMSRLTYPNQPLVGGMIGKFLFSLFILLSMVVPTATEKSYAEMYTLLSHTTLATMSKEVFLIRNFEVREIEANIDSLSDRLTSLRYSSDIELAEPRVVTAKITHSNNAGSVTIPTTVTLFGRLMSLHDASTICSRMGL
jgi:hypothetical protein